MSNPYITNTSYLPQNQQVQSKKNNKNLALFCSGAAVGGLAGGYMGFKTNPAMTKNGNVKDSFAQNVYKNFSKNSTDTFIANYEEKAVILTKLKNIKNVDELKNLAIENPKLFSEIEINLNNIDKSNLNENIRAIEEFTKAKNNSEFVNFKNNIQKCWNSENKKFEKVGEISEDLFNAIKKTANKAKTTKILKYAGIGALAAGIIVFIPKLISTNKNNIQ